jgi:hypothetical protein
MGRGPAPVALATRARLVTTDRMAFTGTERVDAVQATVQSCAAGAYIFHITFDNTLLPRLAAVSRTYQRISYKLLQFDVCAQNPSSTSGGYAAAWVADPDDNILRSSNLLSHKGAVQRKWWEDAVVPGPVRPDQEFYTSLSVAGSLRFHSPGQFVIICDNPPSQAIVMTVNCKYSVVLSQPSIESGAGDTPDVIRAARDLRVCTGESWLQSTVGNFIGTADLFDPPPTTESIYRLPYPIGIEFTEGTGDEGTVQCNFARFINNRAYLRSDWDKSLGSAVKWTADHHGTVLPVGSVLRLESENEDGPRHVRGQMQKSACTYGLPRFSGTKSCVSAEPTNEPTAPSSSSSPPSTPPLASDLTELTETLRSALSLLDSSAHSAHSASKRDITRPPTTNREHSDAESFVEL